jgi:hypothetical protein
LASLLALQLWVAHWFSARQSTAELKIFRHDFPLMISAYSHGLLRVLILVQHLQIYLGRTYRNEQKGRCIYATAVDQTQIACRRPGVSSAQVSYRTAFRSLNDSDPAKRQCKRQVTIFFVVAPQNRP